MGVMPEVEWWQTYVPQLKKTWMEVIVSVHSAPVVHENLPAFLE
jgi:hypothetical protein